jgi:hypothetical protein
MATRGVMQRAEEETKKMAEQLELVNAHAQQVENEITTATRQIEQLEERERHNMQETDTLRKLNLEREEKVSRMAEVLKQANLQVQQVKGLATIAVKRARVTENQEEDGDAGVQAEIIKEKTANEMEVYGNDVDSQFDLTDAASIARIVLVQGYIRKAPVKARLLRCRTLTRNKALALLFDRRIMLSRQMRRQVPLKLCRVDTDLRVDHLLWILTGRVLELERNIQLAKRMWYMRSSSRHSTKPRTNVTPAPELQKTERRCASGTGSSHVR